MPNLNSDSRFTVKHRAGTPDDPNLASVADLALVLTDSASVSLVASRLVSTSASGALDSIPVSTADSKGVSSGLRASVADSKALSASGPTSVADSKALSVSMNTSIADSKAVSVHNSVPILTVVAASQTVSTADSKAVSVATNLVPLPADGRAVTRTSAYLANNATLNVRDFTTSTIHTGATSARPAFLAAIAACVALGYRRIRVPDGTYLIDGEVAISAGIELVGDSMAGTKILHRPTADGICLKVTAGAAISYYNAISDLTIYTDDTTYTKVAIELNDVSSAGVQRINIFGNGTGTPDANYYSGGTGSIGLRTKGREVTGLKDLKIVADKPIVIAANPNTLPTDGEDIDHFSGENFYLVAKGSYCIAVADGLGVSNVTLAGYQAWVGGTGGFYMNDTRVAPVIPPRHLSFANIRGEQCQDPNGYWFNISCTDPIQTLEIKNTLGASTAQGIRVVGCLQLLLDNVTMATAAGKDSLNVSGATGGSVISMRGCYWQPASVVTLTGYTATSIEAYNASLSAGPGTATYVNVRTGTALNVAALRTTAAPTAVALAVGSTTGDVLQVLPAAAGSGATVRAMNNAETDIEPLTLIGETVDVRYRTGVNTSASAFAVDTFGTLTTGKLVPTVVATSVGLQVASTAGGDTFQVLPAAAGNGATIRANNSASTDFTPMTVVFSTFDLRYRTGVATAASAVQVDTSGNLLPQKDLKLPVVGTGVYVKEGTNATAGAAVLVGGTVTVATTKVTANSRIQVTSNVDGGTPGWLRVSARVAGTSFTITSSSGTDTSTVAWVIVEPA